MRYASGLVTNFPPMKRLLFIAITAILAFSVSTAAWYVTKLHNKHNTPSHVSLPTTAEDAAVKEKLNSIAAMAEQYAARNQFSTQICFLIDMSIASGKQRFFVYDLQQNSIRLSGLVTHGRCNQNWLTGRKYGNTVGCGCTSLGKYKVANAYQGRFGLAYKLYGLDATNNNAYNRFVVLHSMQCVPESSVDPYPICQSDGCPTVSPGLLKQLASLIDSSKQPILLWIFE